MNFHKTFFIFLAIVLFSGCTVTGPGVKVEPPKVRIHGPDHHHKNKGKRKHREEMKREEQQRKEEWEREQYQS